MADVLRDTQISVESLETDSDPQMRNSQIVVEALVRLTISGRIHQLSVEILSQELEQGGNPPGLTIIT